MQFVSLTRSILLDLQSKGYNVLTSKNSIADLNPTWYPIQVPDVWDYLLQLDFRGGFFSSEEPAVLVIEDALKHVVDGPLEGQVFLEDDHNVKFQQRLQLYNQYYQFIANPEVYDFSFDPQRLLIRNHAVHTGDHEMYLEYLKLHYPEQAIAGIQDLEDLTRSLICLDVVQAQHWFITHQVAVMESDIWICDEDAILKVLARKEDDHTWHVSNDTDELIYNQMSPHDLLSMHDIFWIDTRSI